MKRMLGGVVVGVREDGRPRAFLPRRSGGLAGAICLLTAIAFSLATPVYAQHDHAPATSKAAPAMTEGEVRKVDKAASKVTLKHGPIESIDMPPMTMTFAVADPKAIEQLAPGDKVRFRAEKRGAQIVVTRIEKTK